MASKFSYFIELLSQVWDLIRDFLRELLALPWLPGAARDALLTLGLALAMMSIDAPGGAWGLWWPLVLLYASAIFSHSASRSIPFDVKQVAFFSLALLALAWRGFVSLAGPQSAAGLRELQSAALIIFSAAALWFSVRHAPLRTLLAWSLALVINYISLLSIHGRTLDYDPAIGITPICVFACVWVAWRSLGRVQDFVELRSLPAAKTPYLLSALFFLVGWLWGHWDVLKLTSRPVDQAVYLSAGQTYLAQAWTQSVLLGWGPRTAGAVAAALAQPRPIALSPWTGFTGLLAQWGVLGVAAFIGALFLLARSARGRGWLPPIGENKTLRSMSKFRSTCILMALVFFGWFFGAGPRAAFPLLCLAGWMALALAIRTGGSQQEKAGDFAEFLEDPGDHAKAHRRAAVLAIVPGILLNCGAIVCIILLFLPVLGSTIFNRADERRLPGDRYRQRLLLAAQLNPFEPQIPLAMAGSLRRAMAQAEGWSESAYLRILAYYGRAARLDRFETIIPMRQARVQAEVDRPEDALQTIKLALLQQPNSRDLLEWIFSAAWQNENVPLAQSALARGLQLEPENPQWWWRQFLLARRTGQALTAGEALAHVLTANPGQETVLNAALENSRAAANPLPEEPDKS